MTTVEAVFFLGDRTRLFVNAGDARPLVVETGAWRTFTHGEVVRLMIDLRGLRTI